MSTRNRASGGRCAQRSAERLPAVPQQLLISNLRRKRVSVTHIQPLLSRMPSVGSERGGTAKQRKSARLTWTGRDLELTEMFKCFSVYSPPLKAGPHPTNPFYGLSSATRACHQSPPFAQESLSVARFSQMVSCIVVSSNH